MHKIVKVHVYQDPDCACPTEGDGQWSIYTFGDHRIITDVELSQFKDEDGDLTQEIRHKLDVGLAFFIRYSGYLPTYDLSDRFAEGLIVWEHDESEIGAKTYEDRHKDAESFLEEYSRWANGDCYGYRIEVLTSTTPEYDPDKSLDNGAYWEDTYDSCWGLIGSDYAQEEIKRALESYEGYRVVYVGDAKHIMG